MFPADLLGCLPDLLSDIECVMVVLSLTLIWILDCFPVLFLWFASVSMVMHCLINSLHHLVSFDQFSCVFIALCFSLQLSDLIFM